jgi:hypothetical protein
MYQEPKLRNGGRIPHVWFSVSSKNCEHTAGNKAATAADGTATAKEDNMVFISSVNLAGWLHQTELNLRLKSQFLDVTGASSATIAPSPRVLLLVDISEGDAWCAAIAADPNPKTKEIFRVVTVSSSADQMNSVDSARTSHSALQRELQVPRYSIRDADKETSTMEVTSQHKFLNSFTPGLSSFSAHPSQPLIGLTDVSGRWTQKCQEYRQSLRQSNNAKNVNPQVPIPRRQELFLPVALRPDGHIAAICDVSNPSDPHIMKYFIDSVRIALRI